MFSYKLKCDVKIKSVGQMNDLKTLQSWLQMGKYKEAKCKSGVRLRHQIISGSVQDSSTVSNKQLSHSKNKPASCVDCLYLNRVDR